jgi:tripartite-type tricarboxylate transporter receptor subunit TctC
MEIPATRRRFLLSATAAACAVPYTARSQGTWPTRPVRLIVPFAPGASIDAIARVIAPKLGARLGGAAVVVENKPGAGGLTGTAFVAGQPPDGHTLLFTSNPFVIAPLLVPAGQKPAYDPAKDLQPIAQIAAAPLIVTVSNELKVANLRELIALAKATPQGIAYGSGGVGTINHLGVEMLARMADVQLIHVPYTGLGPAIAALLGGHVQMMAGTIPSVLPLVREGRARALAVTSEQRSPLMPELPTVAEAGIAGYELEAWWGMLGPAGLPAPLTERLNGEVNGLLSTQDVVDLLVRDGASPRHGSAGDFGNLIQSEIPRWQRLIKDANITG